MTEETMFQEIDVKEDYVDILEDLIKARDVGEACRKLLKSIACLLNTPGAFIALTNQKTSETLSIVAFAGSEFHHEKNRDSVTSAAISENWQNFNGKFECTYCFSEENEPCSFFGFPIFKAGQAPYGFLAIPSDFSIPTYFENVILPSLVSLLADRINEFELLHELDHLKRNEQLAVVERRGIHFPHQDDFFARVRHDINGLLAASSLQTQMLSSSSTTQNSKDAGFDRLMSSIGKIEALLEIQEIGTTVLLSSRPETSLRNCLDIALKTFNVGMSKSPNVALSWHGDDQFVPIRGTVMHWILHNTLRQISVVAQVSDTDQASILVDITPSGIDGDPTVNLVISARMTSMGQEKAGTQINRAILNDGANRHHSSVLDQLVGLVKIFGWVTRLSFHSGQLTISASIPSVPSNR